MNTEQTLLITYCAQYTRLTESILVPPQEADEKLNFPGRKQAGNHLLLSRVEIFQSTVEKSHC